MADGQQDPLTAARGVKEGSCVTSIAGPTGQPTIMFLGDSFVWGLDAEADERFTELLKPRIKGYKVLAAGVSGYGTDQEFLLLKKLWPEVKPAVVVLIFCTDNDRQDNSSNIRYEGYQKPYFATASNTTLADLFAPLFFTDSSFAIWASLSWRSKNEFDDGLAYGRQARLRRRPVDSFFSAPLVRVGDAGGTRRRSLS